MPYAWATYSCLKITNEGKNKGKSAKRRRRFGLENLIKSAKWIKGGQLITLWAIKKILKGVQDLMEAIQDYAEFSFSN